MEDLLLLFLGAKIRLPSAPCEFLTIRELANLPLLSRSIWVKLRRVEYTRCRGGGDYQVPFPGFPGLLSTPGDLEAGAGLFRHQLASIEAMHRAENGGGGGGGEGGAPAAAFGALRGGILGDAPGLGKTVTALALVASTAGARPIDPPGFWDEERVAEGWGDLRSNGSYEASINRALRPIRVWVDQCVPRGSREYETYQGLRRYVTPPYPDGRLRTLREFELHVIRQLRPFVPLFALELFRKNALELKAGLDKRNRRLLCSEEGRRLTLERSLMPCSATLVVVPDALLEHWYQQIHSHLDLSPFADENENRAGSDERENNNIRGVVLFDGIGDLADARMPLGAVSLEAQVRPAWELSRYLMVITTFSRCEGEFRKEVAAGRMRGIPSARGVGGRRGNNKRSRDSEVGRALGRSPLLKMRWLRLIVDEGHELGTHEAGSSVTRFVNEVAAERRWVLSGTPTTGDEDDEAFTAGGLDQLQRLLFFLRHPKYGNIPQPPASKSPYVFNDSSDVSDTDDDDGSVAQARDEWLAAVKKPFLAKKAKGKKELLRILREVMVMHLKEEICLPKSVFKQAEVYIPVPDTIQVNLREANMDSHKLLNNYLETPGFQSLVDQAQAEYIVQTIRNAQQALLDRGGRDVGKVSAAVREYDPMGTQEDCRPIKAVVYSSEKNNLLSVTEHLYRQLDAENIAEMYGGIGGMSAELSRFRNGCKKCRRCPVCQSYNDLTDDRRSGRCQTILLEVVAQDPPHVRFLIEPERICQAVAPENGGNVRSARLEGEPLSSYGSHRASWTPGDILEVDVRDPHPLLPTRESDDTWEEFGSEECKEIAARYDYLSSAWFFGPLPCDGLDRIDVKLAKWQKCGDFHDHNKWYQGPRLADAPVETTKQNAFVLCLDATLAHGLDLSFLTHMFLLEPIDDAALLEQVTSRAHRLGATGPVCVETVNTMYTLSANTEEAMCASTTSTSDTLLAHKGRSVKNIVCQFCYRSFDSVGKAEEHEETSCPRNPDNTKVVDPFHLSSVYREIKPPPPVSTSTWHTTSYVKHAVA